MAENDFDTDNKDSKDDNCSTEHSSTCGCETNKISNTSSCPCDEIVDEIKKINYEALIERAQLICFHPQDAWRAIKSETLSIKEIYVQHLVALVALAAFFRFIKGSILGYSAPIVGTIRTGVISGLAHMVITFFLQLAMIYVFALLLQFIAKQKYFDAMIDIVGMFKLVAYSSVVSLIGALFIIIPYFGGILSSAIALYSIYVLYLGIEPMTGIQKRTQFIIVGLVSMIVVSLIIQVVIPFMRFV